MPLTDTESIRAYMSRRREVHGDGSMTKADIDAAIDAVTTEIPGLLARLNAALPQPYKSLATDNEKIILYAYALLRDQGRLKVKEDN